MFDAPPSTLNKSLNNLLERPKEYLADVCFTFSSIDIWAHRAIILSRAPTGFIERYLSELMLDCTENNLPIKLDISHIIPVELFTPLLRFWYTATFYDFISPQSSVTDLSIKTPTLTSPQLSYQENSGSSISTTNDSLKSQSSISESSDVQHELEQLGFELGTIVLPHQSNTLSDFDQLTFDLKRLRDEHIASDVTILLVSSVDPTDILASFRAHRFILAAQSSYFNALFCTAFQESTSAVIHLTDDLFNASIIDMMLTYFYTDKISVSPIDPDTDLSSQDHRKHAMRVIQKAFYAVDYLGQFDTLGQAMLHEMENMCHQFKCVCDSCAVLLPSMLAWSDKHSTIVPHLRRTIVLLYADPVQGLASLWSKRSFSLLVSSIVPGASSMAESTYHAVLRGEPLFRARPPKTFIHDIEERIFYNVTKHNAIQALHALHLSFSKIQMHDPNPSWSRPAQDLLNPILQYTVGMVSRNFDFYCVEYPILLSCVDGIGGGFSVDFLDFLLRHVLNDGIQNSNAGVIYQGIARDLVGRQEVVKNMAIDDVLTKARTRCAAYIAKHWTQIKTEGGFKTIDKAVLRQLADDTGIPHRSLTKPFDKDFTLFSFKPKKSKRPEEPRRRLSIGQLMTRSLSQSETPSRPRALSTESSFVSNFRRYVSQQDVKKENQPLLTMLSYETIERAQALDHRSPVVQPSLEERPQLRTSSSFTSLTDQLLLVESEKKQKGPERPTRLKFELPAAPHRSKSPTFSANSLLQPNVTRQQQMQQQQQLQQQQQNKRRYSKGRGRGRWSTDDVPRMGDKIELLRRPLPTLGTIKFIGPVQFAEGHYIGVELESRLGKSDGSIDGVRYFQTDPQRGLFVKQGDFIIVSSNR